MEKVTNWGLFPQVKAELIRVENVGTLPDLVRCNKGLIARGNGRSYGDSSLSATMVSTLHLNRILHFSEEAPLIKCEAGLLLADMLQVIVLKGCFLPVTPGTKYITVGGAIAADVHGKNHYHAGSFCKYVEELDLLQANGEVVTCSRTKNYALFCATCGGMGLTGVILSATICLVHIKNTAMEQLTIKAANLPQLLGQMQQHQHYPYMVAWIDAQHSNRALLSLGQPAAKAGEGRFLLTGYQPAKQLSLPAFVPEVLLNRYSIAAYNRWHYAAKRNGQQETLGMEEYFYPLDKIADWNRLYGPRGFMQYQLVLPMATAETGIAHVLEAIGKSTEAPYLTVLKLLGNENKDAVISFPMEGFTLSVDFKRTDTLPGLLEKLDEIVIANNGRVYLAKDARLSAAAYSRMYMGKKVGEGYFQSLQSQRIQMHQL